MKRSVLRAVVCAALIGVVGISVAACGHASETKASSVVRAAKLVDPEDEPVPVLPHGPGHMTFDLGHGVRVYAYWTPGKLDVPWAINIHGGSWRYGSGASRGYLDWAKGEAARGWAAFTVDYRLVPTVTWPQPEQDVQRAIDWIRQHALTFGLDTGHGFLIGHSAGGQLASIAALQLGGFAGVVDIAGAVDPYYIYRDASDRDLSRSAAMLIDNRVGDRPLWHATQAQSYLGQHVMPFLVMHSVNDPVVPPVVNRRFAATLRSHHYPTTYVQIPGGVHNLSSAHDNKIVDDWMDSVLAHDKKALLRS